MAYQQGGPGVSVGYGGNAFQDQYLGQYAAAALGGQYRNGQIGFGGTNYSVDAQGRYVNPYTWSSSLAVGRAFGFAAFDGAIASFPSPGRLSDWKEPVDEASRYGSLVTYLGGAQYDIGGRLLTRSNAETIARGLTRVFQDNPAEYAQALRRMSPVLKSVGSKVGAAGSIITFGTLAYKAAAGTAKRADWVDGGINAVLIAGSFSPIAPLFWGAGLIYGGVRLGWGDEIDRYINKKR